MQSYSKIIHYTGICYAFSLPLQTYFVVGIWAFYPEIPKSAYIIGKIVAQSLPFVGFCPPLVQHFEHWHCRWHHFHHCSDCLYGVVKRNIDTMESCLNLLSRTGL